MAPSQTVEIHFEIAYATHPGQIIYIVGDHIEMGDKNPLNAIPLMFQDNNHWSGVVKLPISKKTSLKYSYFVVNQDGSRNFEGGIPKQITLIPNEIIYSKDTWKTASWLENTLTTAPFRDVFYKNDFIKNRGVTLPNLGSTIFKVAAPGLSENTAIGVLGNHKKLGNWDVENWLPLLKDGSGAWCVSVNIPKEDFPLAYKYVIVDKKTGAFLQFEDGDNRWIHFPSEASQIVAQDGYIRRELNQWKGAGVAVPVFSLCSNKTSGVGSFSDLKPLVDWAKSIGLKLIQVLPVNDTTSTHTWTDSYPYAAISAFALHPMYADITELEQHLDEKLTSSTRNALKFNRSLFAPIDYEAVNNAKRTALKELYEKAGNKTISSKSFKAFVKNNENWLFAYSFFCYFRDLYNTAEFGVWPENGIYNKVKLKALFSKNKSINKAITFNYFVQYHLDRQLRDAHDYAKSKGLIFKGDVPIGIYRHSADAWQQPELYHMNRQAGAPPDDFAIKGQNWGFPTYNWEKMAEDDFLWWQRRFAQMQRYYDAFRIDHILGFFRIWSIPMHAIEGIMGFFEPALPIAIHEFDQRYIPFDYKRFVTPFLTKDFLNLRFGKDASLIEKQFMDTDEDGTFALKKDFDTQQKVAAFCKNHSEFGSFKEGLFDCISNVILFEAPDSKGQEFHFRFNMHHTYSFQQLPLHLQGSLKAFYNNYFFQRQDDLWKKEALQKLPRLKFATDMLVCGEDLGLVPACVPTVMQDLGLLSLEIQRMPKDPNTKLLNVKNTPYTSVATPATHDTSTIRGWWQENREQVQCFFNDHLGLPGDAPKNCSGSLAEAVISAHLNSPSMWSVFQLQDLLALDEDIRHPDIDEERINIPANPKHYWRYRMHLTLGELKKAKVVNTKLKSLIENSGR